MTITETGPIVALLNSADGNHLTCKSAAQSVGAPLVTTQACLTEAMYLLYRDTGTVGQTALWSMVVEEALIVVELTPGMMSRAGEFMVIYRDIPCDYADATVLALADNRNSRRVFTIDSHFYAYRLGRGRRVEVVP